MKEYQDLKINGYTNKWSAFDKLNYNGMTYYILENNTWGDETCYLVIDENKSVICETYDSIRIALEDEGILL